jgi:hypothetical protein
MSGDVNFGGATSLTAFSASVSGIWSNNIALPVGRVMADGTKRAMIIALYGYANSSTGSSHNIALKLGSSQTGQFSVANSATATNTGWTTSSNWLVSGGTAQFKILTNSLGTRFGRGGSGSNTFDGTTTFSGTLGGGYRWIEAPSAPTGLALTPSGATVTATWNAPASNGGSSVTGYSIQYADNPGFTSATTLTSTARTVSIPVTVGQLYVRVAAKNAVTTAAGSTSVWSLTAATSGSEFVKGGFLSLDFDNTGNLWTKFSGDRYAIKYGPVETLVNLHTNPGLEIDATGYDVAAQGTGNTFTVTRQTSGGHSGTAFWRAATSAANTTASILRLGPAVNVSVGRQYTVGAWVRPSAAVTVQIGVRSFTGADGTGTEANVTGTSVALAANVWGFISYTYTVTAGIASIRPSGVLGIGVAAAGRTFDFDDLSVSIGASVSDFNGDTPNTSTYSYDWQGTAGASISTRVKVAAAIDRWYSGSSTPDQPVEHRFFAVNRATNVVYGSMGSLAANPMQSGLVERYPWLTLTLERAFRYYIGLIDPSITVTYSASTNPEVAFAGWEANSWTKVNELASAWNVEVTTVAGAVVVRDVGTRTQGIADRTPISDSVSLQGNAEFITVGYTNSVSGTSVVYDASSDDNIITFNPHDRLTSLIQIPHSLVSVVPPRQTTSLPVEDGEFIVSDSDGKIIPTTTFSAAGGQVLVSIAADAPNTIILSIRGPQELSGYTAPYSLSYTTDLGAEIPALKIIGSGVMQDPREARLYTGSTPNATPRGDGQSIDTEFIITRAQAYDRGRWAAIKAGGPTRSISFSLAAKDCAGLGLTEGSLFEYRDCIWRIDSATLTKIGLSITASYYTKVQDIDARWSGQTVANFDSYWSGSGFDVRDVQVKPLR